MTSPTRHLLIFPFPNTSHLRPFLNLTLNLLDTFPSLIVTCINTSVGVKTLDQELSLHSSAVLERMHFADRFRRIVLALKDDAHRMDNQELEDELKRTGLLKTVLSGEGQDSPWDVAPSLAIIDVSQPRLGGCRLTPTAVPFGPPKLHTRLGRCRSATTTGRVPRVVHVCSRHAEVSVQGSPTWSLRSRPELHRWYQTDEEGGPYHKEWERFQQYAKQGLSEEEAVAKVSKLTLEKQPGADSIRPRETSGASCSSSHRCRRCTIVSL